MGKAYKLHEIRTTPCLHLLVTLFCGTWEHNKASAFATEAWPD